MAELHTNGNYEAYLAQLFNPLAGGVVGSPLAGGGFGGIGTGTGPGTTANMAALLQNPWAAQSLPQANAFWPQQPPQYSAQSLPAMQIAQQVAARQAVQAIQQAQAQQALQQLVQSLAAQQWAQLAVSPQAQFGHGQFGHGIGGGFGTGQGLAQFYGPGTQNLVNQALQQQVLQQLAQYLAAQQLGQFRYGLAA